MASVPNQKFASSWIQRSANIWFDKDTSGRLWFLVWLLIQKSAWRFHHLLADF